MWKNHTQAKERARHMREFRLDQWKGGSHRHAQSLAKISDHLLEAGYRFADTKPDPSKRGQYASEMAGQVAAFSHSQQAFYGMSEQVPGLVK